MIWSHPSNCMHCLHYTLGKKAIHCWCISYFTATLINVCQMGKSTSYNVVHLYVLFPLDSSRSFYSSIIPPDHQTLRVDLAVGILLPWWKDEHEKGELTSRTLLATDRKEGKGTEAVFTKHLLNPCTWLIWLPVGNGGMRAGIPVSLHRGEWEKGLAQCHEVGPVGLHRPCSSCLSILLPLKLHFKYMFEVCLWLSPSF